MTHGNCRIGGPGPGFILSNGMPVCPECRKTYVRSHTVCRAGTCSVCRVSLQDLDAHRCPIRQVLNLDLIQTWARLCKETRIRSSCHACGTSHFIKKNIHGFRMFFGVELCWNCYTIPEIAEHVTTMRIGMGNGNVPYAPRSCLIPLHSRPSRGLNVTTSTSSPRPLPSGNCW